MTRIIVVDGIAAEVLARVQQEVAETYPEVQVIGKNDEGIVIRDMFNKRPDEFEGPVLKYKKYDDREYKPLLMERRVHPKKQHSLRSIAKGR